MQAISPFRITPPSCVIFASEEAREAKEENAWPLRDTNLQRPCSRYASARNPSYFNSKIHWAPLKDCGFAMTGRGWKTGSIQRERVADLPTKRRGKAAF